VVGAVKVRVTGRILTAPEYLPSFTIVISRSSIVSCSIYSTKAQPPARTTAAAQAIRIRKARVPFIIGSSFLPHDAEDRTVDRRDPAPGLARHACSARQHRPHSIAGCCSMAPPRSVNTQVKKPIREPAARMAGTATFSSEGASPPFDNRGWFIDASIASAAPDIIVVNPCRV
jgi:hypothetical protein